MLDILADVAPVVAAAEHDLIKINPVWIASILFSVLGLGFGWYIVRLDHMVEHLRDEIIKIEKEIGALQNADVTCTADQQIMKQDMSSIRDAILKLITRRRLRKILNRAEAMEQIDRSRKLGMPRQ